MATTKKPATKKPATKKASIKKTPPKKSAPAKVTAKQPARKSMRSFRVSSADQPFTSFRITRQTIYWLILIAFIIFMQLWILKLQIEVATLLELQQQEILNNF